MCQEGGGGTERWGSRRKGKAKTKTEQVGGVMVVSWQFTSCTYQDRVIFLLSPLKPSEEKFKESLTKDAKVTGDEETLMNRRKKKKAKLAEYRVSKTFLFSREAKVMLVGLVWSQTYRPSRRKSQCANCAALWRREATHRMPHSLLSFSLFGFFFLT